MIITPDGIRERMGRREFVGLAVGAFVVATVPLARRRPPVVVRRSIPVMGTIAQFAVVERDERRAQEAIDAAIAELRWVERVMTRFSGDSDVGRVNRLASRDAVPVTGATACVVAEGLRWADAVDGRYDPAAGAICALWDVKRRHAPPAEHLVASLAGRRFHRTVEVGMNGGRDVLRFHDESARLDLGSVAKGYGVDRAIAALREKGIVSAVVVAGGDLYALGSAPDGDPWTVGIQSPASEQELVGTLRLSDRAVATSGTYRQYFEHRGRRYHHIMDPATASPRVTAMQSLSIVATTVMQADAASTALFGLPEQDIHRALRRYLPDAQLARVI